MIGGFVMDITIRWDEESCVWIATNSEIGLILESGSYDALVERVRSAVPELLELNHIAPSPIILKTEDRTVAIA